MPELKKKKNNDNRGFRHNFIYEPSDDTFFLLSCISNHLDDYSNAKKNQNKNSSGKIVFFEAGIGNAYTAKELYWRDEIKKICGNDININAVRHAQKTMRINMNATRTGANEKKNHGGRVMKATKKKQTAKEVIIKKGSFNSPFQREKFDIIAFNPPYLPEMNEDKYLNECEKKAIIGGKKGIETTVEFLEKIKSNLKKSTVIFIIASSLSDFRLLEHIILNSGYNIASVREKKLGFEKLYCYALECSDALKYSIEKKYDMRFFARGKRSIVYKICRQGNKRGNRENAKSFAVKQSIQGKNTNLKNEHEMLSFLKGKINVPKPFFIGKSFMVMEFIDGKNPSKCNADEIIKIHDYLIRASIILDMLKIKKHEMIRPYRNVIYSKGKTYIIDFERARKKKTGNLNQLLEYFRRKKIIKMKKMIELSEEYNRSLKKYFEMKEKSAGKHSKSGLGASSASRAPSVSGLPGKLGASGKLSASRTSGTLGAVGAADAFQVEKKLKLRNKPVIGKPEKRFLREWEKKVIMSIKKP